MDAAASRVRTVINGKSRGGRDMKTARSTSCSKVAEQQQLQQCLHFVKKRATKQQQGSSSGSSGGGGGDGIAALEAAHCLESIVYLLRTRDKNYQNVD